MCYTSTSFCVSFQFFSFSPEFCLLIYAVHGIFLIYNSMLYSVTCFLAVYEDGMSVWRYMCVEWVLKGHAYAVWISIHFNPWRLNGIYMYIRGLYFCWSWYEWHFVSLRCVFQESRVRCFRNHFAITANTMMDSYHPCFYTELYITYTCSMIMNCVYWIYILVVNK